ncbi:MAG: hypothetical protein ABIQ88_22085 [Chitinophagaceae bacterium]
MQQPVLGDGKMSTTSLKLTAQKKLLTKNQQAFNRLITRIASLSREIETDTVSLRRLAGVYDAAINPLVQMLATEKIALAKALDGCYTIVKLSESQKNEAVQVIFDLLTDAFQIIEPDADTAALFRHFAGVSHSESLHKEAQQRKAALQDQLRDVFGIDIDMGAFDESPEGLADFREKMNEKITQQQQQNKRKKSKKQVAKESSLQQQEAINKRSLRAIYLSLAKLLHPDTELNEALKKEKEELMKEVTRAYNEKDLSALLTLEIQWLATENDHLDKLTDGTLQIYIVVLKEQVKELETEKANQRRNPVFQPIIRLLAMSEEAAENAITYEKKQKRWYIEQMKNHTKSLNGDKRRHAVRDCIKFYYKPPANDQAIPSVSEMMEIFAKNSRRR